MKLVTEKDEMMRRYLLDQMSDEERNSVEENFLEDDNFFEEITALEDELYYDYKQNRLSTQEKIAFEKIFLATSNDLEKAEFVEAFLQATAEISAEKTAPSLWQSVVAFFSFSNASFRLGSAIASILLLFIVGFWILNNSNRKIDDVAVGVPETINVQTPTPTPFDEKIIEDNQKEQEKIEKKITEEKQKTEQNDNKIKELEKQKENLNREIEKNINKKTAPPAQPQKTFLALILSPGLVRDGSGKIPKIKLTPEIQTLNLTLPIKKGVEAENVKIVVRSIGGGQISSSSAKLGTRKSLSLGVPSKNLKRGDYEIVLINSADNEELESYYFSVEK